VLLAACVTLALSRIRDSALRESDALQVTFCGCGNKHRCSAFALLAAFYWPFSFTRTLPNDLIISHKHQENKRIKRN
jgi:hypothetical protein